MADASQRWERIYDAVPLATVPGHFAAMSGSPFMIQYLSEVLRRVPRGGRALETGIGSGYGSVWLSLRGVEAEGIDYSPVIVERSRQINSILAGRAKFELGDLFHLHDKNVRRYDVIHSQGVFEHFSPHQIKAALAQQVACADHVVFSVPSCNYPFDPEFGDERLLPIEEWASILDSFKVEELRYYGDPRLGGQEQILCVLNGQPIDDELLALMHPGPKPYKPGISAIVHTRNEAQRIGDCLRSLVNFVDEIIVCDMDSEDSTVDIASQFTDNIMRHPLIANFDQSRNASAMRAQHSWILYVDADERASERLGRKLREIALSDPEDFDGLLIPFRHHFAGHWMRSMYPGYTAPRLLRNSKFIFNSRLHSGAQVDGPVIALGADDPDMALTHYSFDSLSHYLDKLNKYTDGESLNMWRDGQAYHWQSAIGHFVHDFRDYFERGQGGQDQVHGFMYAFNSAFYRFHQHSKLYERRFHNNQATDWEKSVPADMEEMLVYMLRLCRQKPRPRVRQIEVIDDPRAAGLLWTGPVLDRSGYGDESRNLLMALDQAGTPVAAQSLPWGEDASLADRDARRLKELNELPVLPGFTQIVHTFGSHLERHPLAGLAIGRTVFETDRLPREWVDKCNKMDAVWVPSEFNRKTFTDAGVQATKIQIVPECFDAGLYRDLPTRQKLAKLKDNHPAVRESARSHDFVFLSVFDWTLHKAWDVLFRAFLTEFGPADGAQLVLKVWSSNGYTDEQIREQAREFVSAELGVDLDTDPRVRFVQEYLSETDLRNLYVASHAYVLPSRGEGWGRPYMEAMACGLPTIATGWGGNTEFMTPENSFLIDSRLVAVPERGWREVVTYKGHRWSEPDASHLQKMLRQIFTERDHAASIGAKAREYVLSHYSREAVGPVIAETLQACRSGEGTRDEGSEPSKETTVRLRWEGAMFRQHSLGHVNRELCLGLLNTGVELSIVPTEPDDFSPMDVPALIPLAERCFAPLSGAADVHVRHGFPPRFEAPGEGCFVLMQPWEYGYIPNEWVRGIAANVAEVWCNSGYVRDVYLNSGVPEEKLHLVPLGIDPEVFRPDVLPFIFTDEPGASRLSSSTLSRKQEEVATPFVFLFVGGTLNRKGFDILLDAYLKAFSAYDDVVLVVKDTCVNTVYQGQNHREQLIELAADEVRPKIVYIDAELPASELAGIYSIADCLVAPYRGEGFCLPVLEAMACGTPVIVPLGGPTDDFVDETVGWQVPARRVPFGDGKVGQWECAGPTWMLEVGVDDLARQMRAVAADRKECEPRGQAASERARTSWTWEKSVEKVRERLIVLQAASGSPLTFPKVGNLPLSDSMEAGNPATTNTAGIPRQPTLSLCMIVKNEERVLGDCLASIRPYVDEMIVVDTGSTDRTVAIAEEHGAKVFHFPWTESFSEARNESIAHATGDFILWMDADDTIPPECGEQLRNTILLTEDKVTGLMMQVRIPPAPGESGLTVVDHVKIFRNGLGLKFTGRIHEQLLEGIYQADGEVCRTDLYVVHSGYDYSVEGQKGKRVRDLRLLELDLSERPDHPFVLFNIGMTAFHMKEFPKAKETLERCLKMSGPNESILRKVYAMLGGSELELGNLQYARERIEQGLKIYPRDPELLFRAGIIYHECGELPLAEQSYLRLLNDHEIGHIDSIDISMTTYKAHHNLGVIYRDMGRLNEADRHWRIAGQQEKEFLIISGT